MKVPIPHFLTMAFDIFGDWANVEIYKWVRRIDVMLLLAGIGCIGYYWFVAGWMGALQGGMMYVLVAMAALWMF